MYTYNCSYCKKEFKRVSPRDGNWISCSRECRLILLSINRKGENNPAWNGGKSKDHKGYVLIRNTTHHRSVGGYVREHILVMEEKIGRPVLKTEVVHHINHKKDDNRPENLKLYSSNVAHMRDEKHFRKKKDKKFCKFGKKIKALNLCSNCYKRKRRNFKPFVATCSD